jgi:hypothetical protein
MAVPQVPGDVNQDDLINSVNNVVRELNNKEQVQVFKDEAGTRRVILDKDGLRTSPAGVDVYTATNDQLTFNSNNNVFKIVATYDLTIPSCSLNTGGANYSSGTPTGETVSHNLGYAPAIMAFVSNGGSYVPLPWTHTAGWGSGGFAYISILCSVDDTEVSVSANISGYNTVTSEPELTVKVYLLQETAN